MADPEDTEVEQAVRDTENQIMQEAFAPEPKEPAEEPAKERPRDELGRFAKTSPQQPAEETPAPAPTDSPPAKPEEEEILPSWRAREINEERRRVQAENEAMRAEYARMQARMAQFEQAQQRQAAPPPPDPVLDPQGFARQVREEMRAEFMAQQQNDRLTMNLEMAHMRHGERFEKAYEALLIEGQRGNSQLVRHFVSQPNPGEAIVRWHMQNEVMRQVGPDVSAFQKKTREELLDDDAFYNEMQERRRARALGGNNQPPNVVTKLPPSLSKATGGSPAAGDSELDGSDTATFAHVMSQPRRR